ncbi:hypothetical protein H4R20_000441 [Coemansia guatemalensis]|uniref:Mediator of RNA polymerase II transcription subunit 23 n=1 Tax=Coemansia guatemalensis TaxID=2761395 RepID=A0A9W8I1E7_9FUNG|nr:hypothetical protein H4R20_000441 [Coemansia guatemalensis]
METLVEYLTGVVESSYEDLEHLVPCGSFLGLFDERPIKRTRVSDSSGGWQQPKHHPQGPTAAAFGLLDYDNSEATGDAITRLTLEAIGDNTVTAVDVLGTVVDAVRSTHDASAVLDIGFRSLFEIYQRRLEYHSANRYRAETVAAAAAAAAEKPTNETFGAEYLQLTRLFELDRPRTWVAAVRLVSMVTKSAIAIMYGGTADASPSLSTGTHAASLSEISGLNLLPESVCREAVRQVWRLLLDSATKEATVGGVLGTARRTRWQIRFEATMELFDNFVGRAAQSLGRPLVSYYVIARELDPGAAVAESGILPSEMQRIVDLCFVRKRRLGRILLPPDGSWPLISHASRAHTVKHVYDQPGYALVRDSLTSEEAERGPSANRYVADLLFQRAPTDEIFAAIRNHRIMQKKAQAAVAGDSYVPGEAAAAVVAAPASEVSGTGRAALTEPSDAERHEVGQLLLEAMAQRVEQTVRFIQKQCDFETLADERQTADTTMVVPSNVRYWEGMNEVADQLYYFVLMDAVSYTDVHARLYAAVFPRDGDLRAGVGARRDNAYIWILLQLMHIEKVAAGPVRADLQGDEDMLDQLVQMYNERQIVSRDAFYVRDLALQAALNHQQGNIRDNQGVKFRHPRMVVAMPFAPVVFRLQHEFGQQFKDGRSEQLDGRSEAAVMKAAAVSQMRQYVVPNALYTFLVPAREEVGQLQGAATTFLRGGNIGHRLLDFLNVGGKHRLLQLVYKMMLAHEQGPQFQFEGRAAGARPGITCVSPHVVDTVYQLLYTAPYSNELMMKEVLEKLRRCDKAMALGNARFSAANMRWLYTVYQLMNCRLLRFFKYYAHASHLVHHLRHSLVHVTHRQLYGSLECFALCLVNLQHDVGFLQALLNPAYHGIALTPHTSAGPAPPAPRYAKPKDAWFECAMLARNAAMVIARIEAMRGLGDVPGLSLDDCLDSLSPQPQRWAPAVLRYLPRAVRGYYARRAKQTPGPGPAAAPSPAAVRSLAGAAVHNVLMQGQMEDQGQRQTPMPRETDLLAFYADERRQPLFLCVVWLLLERTPNASPEMIAIVRRVLLTFPLPQMAVRTAALVDFVVACEAEHGATTPSDAATQRLDDVMFKYRLVQHEHVVFALTRGEHDLRGDSMRLALTRFVLLDAPSFDARLREWHGLDFQGRYWADYGHWQKQSAYLSRFPDFFEHEAFLTAPLDPPPAMALPVYYESSMVRLLPVLEFALGRMIEAEDRALLRDVLDRLGILYRLHQVPLTTLMNTLFLYFNAPTLHDAAVVRSLNLSLLDLSQQSFSPEFVRFVRGESMACRDLDAGYVCRMSERIASVISRRLTRPANAGLPEIQYREIPNPILLALSESAVELLTWWCLHCAEQGCAPLHDPAATTPPAPASESEFCAEEALRRSRAAQWPLGRLWLELTMDPTRRPERGAFSGATYIHATAVLANMLPDELLAFPVIEHLADVVLNEPVLRTQSTPRRYFSFAEFARAASHGRSPGAGDPVPADSAPVDPAATAVFNSFEQNRARHMANRPNTYLTLLHSVLHYGGVATFNTLAATIHRLADGAELCSDLQLLYLCATIGPILYRLVDHEQLYVQILADLLTIMAHICPRIAELDADSSTDAVEQVMDFFCFVKDQFDPGRPAWRRIAPHIAALPPLLRCQLQSVVDQ